MLGESGERKPGFHDALFIVYKSIVVDGAVEGARLRRERRRRVGEGGRGRAGGGARARAERVFKLRNASPSRPSRTASVCLCPHTTTIVPVLRFPSTTMTTQFDGIYHGLSPEVGSKSVLAPLQL